MQSRRTAWFGRMSVRRWLMVTLVAYLVVFIPIAAASFRNSGAGNCGNFEDAVAAAQDGDAITLMYDNGEGRNSGGATLVDDLIIEGGWAPPASNCPEVNGSYATSAALLNAGFSYLGPASHGLLKYPSGNGPVMTIGSQVKNLLVYAADFQVENGQTTNGGGVFGTNLSGTAVRFEQVQFKNDPGFIFNGSVSGNGAGLNLDVTNGSRVSLSRVSFQNLQAQNGGGFDITLRGKSHLTLDKVTVANTSASSNGGGGRIIIESGYVTITDSLFTNTSAGSAGDALRIERTPGATGPATVWISGTRFDSSSALSVGDGVTVVVLDRQLYLPMTRKSTGSGAQITRIQRTLTTYKVEFTTEGFTPSMAGQHVHFFFDTVPQNQAGMPGSGPWAVYAGASPFIGLGVANRPPGAVSMCILVANADHSIVPGTGNCFPLN